MLQKVLILVEGQTEELLVKQWLQPWLITRNINIIPIIISTKKTKTGRKFKGGITSFEKIKQNLRPLLIDSSASAVTTFFDYYGLPDDFPGRRTVQGKSCYERVEFLEKAFQKEIEHPGFIPFLMLHELEGLLFASPIEISKTFPEYNVFDQLQKIKNSYNSPEEINEGDQTHPSARISLLIRGFEKVIHGPLIIQRIGLDLIRRECSHFNQWLYKLEALQK